MPDILPTINNEPPQGIQALLDTVYLWNPDVANDLIEKINELLAKLGDVSGTIPPYSELNAPVAQYTPCYNGDNVYVAARDLDTLPATINLSDWILIATKAPVLQAGTGIEISGNEISVTQDIVEGAAAGATAVQATELGSAAYTDTNAYATAAQGALADTALQSVKTINGNTIVGSGDLELSTFLEYPNTWPTTGTTKAFCDAIAADTTTTEGKAYLGEVTLTDLPAGIANSEIEVKIMSGTTAQGKIILLTLTSGNVSPYKWQYTYWNGGSDVSGWVDFLSSSSVVNNYNSTSATAPLSANMGHDLNERLSSVEGRGRFLSTWNCTTGLATTNPPQSPYAYQAGDYFIVGVVGTTNYKPSGSSYTTGVASSVVETNPVAVNDTYQYDGTNWILLKNTVDDPLPSQTGNAGKFLTTDGTDASWSDKPLVNKTTANNAIAIAPTVISVSNGNYGVSIGNEALAKELGVSVGYNAGSLNSSVKFATCIGYASRVTAIGGYQFGRGTNSEAGTVYFALNTDGNNTNWTNYKLLDSDGTIPADRLVHAINKYSTMPTAASTNEGWIVQFTGTTDSTYTHGHLYECVSDGGNPATYSWTEVQLGGGGSSYTAGTGIDITSGVISVTSPTLQNNINSSSQLILLSSKTTVGSQSILIGAYSYNVNGNNTVAIGDHCGANGNNAVTIGASARGEKNNTVSIGAYSNSHSGTVKQGLASTAVGCSTKTDGDYSIALGYNAQSTATNAIQLGSTGTATTNSDSNTFKVANANGNFEMMSADGTIPTDRFTATPSADGTYYPTLSISSGTATRSWGTINALQNTATGSKSLTIGGTATTYSSAVNIGYSSAAYAQGTAVGAYSTGGQYGTAVGETASSGGDAVSIGFGTQTSTSSIAIGYNAKATGNYAIQLGKGKTNSDSNTFKVANQNGNYEMMSADGTIPTARLTKVNSTITLTAAGWSSNTQTVNVTGMTATGVVMVSPDPTDQSAYTSVGILCTAQAAGTLTFTCDTVPSADIDVNVVCL